jgi:hypothetical protein
MDISLRSSLSIKRGDSYRFVVDTTWNSIVCGGHIFMHDVLEIIPILYKREIMALFSSFSISGKVAWTSRA